MFFIVRLVSSKTSLIRVFSKISNQWSCVSFGVFMKSFVSILPPGTHHLFGKAFSFGERLQIRYLPSLFLIMPVTAIWWVLSDVGFDFSRFGNSFISFIILWVSFI